MVAENRGAAEWVSRCVRRAGNGGMIAGVSAGAMTSEWGCQSWWALMSVCQPPASDGSDRPVVPGSAKCVERPAKLEGWQPTHSWPPGLNWWCPFCGRKSAAKFAVKRVRPDCTLRQVRLLRNASRRQESAQIRCARSFLFSVGGWPSLSRQAERLEDRLKALLYVWTRPSYPEKEAAWLLAGKVHGGAQTYHHGGS